LLGELADHARAHVLAPVVELLLELVLDDLALLLDHQDLFEAGGELADRVGLERPGHGHLEQTQTDPRGLALVQAELVQRFQHVLVGLAAGHDAQPRLDAVGGAVDRRCG
jgi:hypothetical protein